MKLLHIDSSILAAGSVSRILTADLVAAEAKLHPDLEITYFDLADQPFQHLSGAHLAGAPEADVAAGVQALETFLAADIIVIGAPMYNFAIPSQLKAWIDRIVVAGKTFQYGANGPEGLAKGKKVLIASSRGGAYFETPIEFLDHQEAYLKAIFGFMGISDLTIYRAENVARPDLRDASIAATEATIKAIAA